MAHKIKPTDITLAHRRPPTWKGWIPTFTGDGFNVLKPEVDQIRLEDLAHGLAFKFRYAGQTTPVTVAEHSIMVSRVIGILWPESKEMAGGLLHDSCQAYLHDIQSPVRRYARMDLPHGESIPWDKLEAKVNGIIAKALGLEPRFWATATVKAANLLAVVIERRDCAVLSRQTRKGLPKLPEEIDHLHLSYLSPEDAQEAFLAEYSSLT
jgi:hypothetical protein